MGEPFETEFEYTRLKSLLLDMFSGPKTDSIRLGGIENVYLFIAFQGKVHFKNYRILYKKSGTRLPRTELEEMGPSFDLTVRRHQLASDDLYKRALKQPDQLKRKKVKNISKSKLGTTFARVHMERQDYGKLQTRKNRALKQRPVQMRSVPMESEPMESTE